MDNNRLRQGIDCCLFWILKRCDYSQFLIINETYCCFWYSFWNFFRKYVWEIWCAILCWPLVEYSASINPIKRSKYCSYYRWVGCGLTVDSPTLCGECWAGKPLVQPTSSALGSAYWDSNSQFNISFTWLWIAAPGQKWIGNYWSEWDKKHRFSWLLLGAKRPLF